MVGYPALLKYHALCTRFKGAPKHIILSLGQPVLTLFCKSEHQAKSSYYHFDDFGI